MRTRFAIPLFIGLFLTLVLFSAEPPIQRQPWTTNTPGAWNAVGSNITFYRSDAYNRPFRVFSTNSSINTFLVNSNGTVGINTNIPQANFHVVGTTLIDGPFTNTTGNASFLGGTTYFEDGIVAAQPSIMNGLTATNLTVYESDAYNVPLRVMAVSTTRPGFLVNSNGYVGIGTNNPLYTLQINASAANLQLHSLSVNRAYTQYRNDGTYANFGLDNNLGTGLGVVGVLPYSFVFLTGETPVQFYPKLLHAATFNTNGCVGIGTNAPTTKLTVKDNVANSDAAAIDISNDAQTWRMNVQGSPAWMGNDDFRIVDVTDSSAVALGIDAGDQVVYIPNGLHSTNLIATTVLGVNAANISQNTNGISIGYNAGAQSKNSQFSVFAGYLAGFQSSNSYYSVFNGAYAGRQSTNCFNSFFDGAYAGNDASNCYGSAFVGSYSGQQSTNAYTTVFNGTYSGQQSSNVHYSIFSGPYSGQYSKKNYETVAVGYQSAQYGSNDYNSVFLGSLAGKQSENANNCVYIGRYCGTNTVRPNTLLIDTAYKGTNALVYGEFDNNLVRINDRLQVYSWTNNAGVDKVNQPIGLFASLKMTTTNTVAVGVAGTYYNITNWTSVVTNGFTASTLGWGGGFVTNQYAGFYRISGSVAALPGNSDTVELEVFFDETQNKELASFGSYDNPARIRTLPLTGSIIYIPANTGISLRISNESDTDDIDIWRASLTIGTP